jgi:hypothetical protein
MRLPDGIKTLVLQGFAAIWFIYEHKNFEDECKKIKKVYF